MRIMEIISGGDINGAIVHCQLLVRELAARGHRLTVVCPHNAWIGNRFSDNSVSDNFLSDHPESDNPVQVIRSDLHRWPLDELRRISAIVRQSKIDVIHTHMSRANTFGILLRMATGTPCVATAHSRHVQLHWMLNDRVIAVSETTTRYHRRFNLVRSARIETIHNFIDHRRFSMIDPAVRGQMRAELGVGQDDLLIGQVGDVIARKGLIHLVRSLPRILAAAPRAKLLVVGDVKNSADYKAAVRREAQRLGVEAAIIWTGRRRDIPELLTALDIYALASLEECFPISVLEAMATGLPVVATDVGGLSECVIRGVTGHLVPAANPEALAAGLIALTTNASLRKQFGLSAIARVQSHYSGESQTPQIEAAFRRVVKSRRAA